VRAERAATLPVARACFARRSTTTSLGRHCEDLDATHGPILLLLYSNLLLLPPASATTRHSTNHNIRIQGRTAQPLNCPRRGPTTTDNTNLMMNFPFLPPSFGCLSFRNYIGMDKERKTRTRRENNKGHTQLLHIAFPRCSLLFELFYTALSFFLAGVMERWDDANEYRYPPFFLFLSFISSSGWLVGRYVYLSGLLA